MIRKDITYINFNDEEVTETHYFHLSKADIVELQMSKKGGMDKWIENIIASEDGQMIMSEFKKIVLLSYGKRSDDGRQFIRTQELRDEFLATEAYSTLFVELCTDAGAAAEFINGVVPKNLEMPKMMAEKPVDLLKSPINLTAPVSSRVLTKAEVVAMDSEQLKHLIAQGATILGD